MRIISNEYKHIKIIHHQFLSHLSYPINYNYHQFSSKQNKYKTTPTSYQSLKDEYADTSPFRARSGTSTDPLYDPDSIVHPILDDNKQKQKQKQSFLNKNEILNNSLNELTSIQTELNTEDIETELTSSDINHIIDETKDLKLFLNDYSVNNEFKDNKNLKITNKSKINFNKKRIEKLKKYENKIYDPMDRPIIRKKRIFKDGDKCDGCGVMLQDKYPDKIGFVQNIDNKDKMLSPPIITPNNSENTENRNGNENENENGKQFDDDMEMKNIYIPDHQRLLLMDLGILGKRQKHLTYKQYRQIHEVNTKLNKKQEKVVLEQAICARCFQLENYKKISIVKSNSIIPEQFHNLLTNRLSRNKINLQQICIIKIIDIFDFHGSFIPNLYDIINGIDNNYYNKDKLKEIPIILALNKIDLLTPHVRNSKSNILIDWAYDECKRFNFNPYSIIPICSKTGYNVETLFETAIKATPIRTSIKRHSDLTTTQRYRDIYVIGTTNVGKSTLINYLFQKELIYSTTSKNKLRLLTTSNIPATTLDIIPFISKKHLNTRLLDTPGVINDNHLCLKLTDNEYKRLIPKNELKPVTYKVYNKQSILLGCLGRLDIDYIGDNDDCDDDDDDISIKESKKENWIYCTIFVAHMCTIHITSTEKIDEVIKLHSGYLLKPIDNIERLIDDPSLNMEKKNSWKLNCIGLQYAVCDVVFPQIGWCALTGNTEKIIKFTAHSVKDSKVGIRKPLLPRDTFKNVKKYNGVPHRKW